MTDIIVSAFATPPESLYRSLAQDLTLFTRPPLVLDVPPKMEPGEVLASPGFARVASEYKRRDPGGSILRPLFKERLSGVTVETVTLIGFSAGNTLLTEILKGPDAQWIDAVITLDGMVGQKLWNGSWHEPSLAPWVDFAAKAAAHQRLFVNAHTTIASHSSQVGSTFDTASAVVTAVAKRMVEWPAPMNVDLSPLTAGPPPPAVTISSQRGTETISRTWDTMPPPDMMEQIGNMWTLGYEGTAEPDHIFIARYVQRAVWRTFLAPRRNGKGQTACTTMPEAPRGLGADMCVRSPEVTVPPDTYPTPSNLPVLGSMAAGLAFGAGVGYLLGTIPFKR